MAYLDWPAAIPFRPERDSWSVKPFREPLETVMQAGNVRVRRRPGDRLATMRWGRLLLPAQVAPFSAFIASIGNGTQRFWMPVCLDGATFDIRLVQITGGIPEQASPGGATLTVNLTLLVWPAEMTPAIPSITAAGATIDGTGTTGATVQLDIDGISRSAVAALGAWSVATPALAAGRHLVRARYVGGPWSVPFEFVTSAGS